MDGGDDGSNGRDPLRLRQEAKLQPLGQALRATYDAENHATRSIP